MCAHSEIERWPSCHRDDWKDHAGKVAGKTKSKVNKLERHVLKATSKFRLH